MRLVSIHGSIIGASFRPVTLLSVLVFQGEGGSIVNGIAGGGGGIVEIRETGVGDFSFENGL